jgi:hypothetical protein
MRTINKNNLLTSIVTKQKILITFCIMLSLILSVIPANARRNLNRNAVPIAKAGQAQTGTVGTMVTLNGNGSYDPDGQPISYTWKIASLPAGSLSTLANRTTVTSSFTPDVVGDYVASLVVTDSAGSNSSASKVTVTVNSPNPAPPPTQQTVKTPIYGVTLDDLSNMKGIIESLVHLPYKPTVRVVFDKGVSAISYYPSLVQLQQYAYIMGEIMDSSDFPTTLANYTARTNELVSTLKTVVDIWEIANEINGEWLRPNPSGSDSTVATQEQQIGQMVAAAFDIVKNVGGKVAVTLYYNTDSKGNNCYENRQDDWRTWPLQFLSSAVRSGTDYALFSYYPYQDCPGLSPNWKDDFLKLESMFPNALVGFGEIGTSSTNAPWSVQSDLITTYYPMVDSFADPKFIGGVFWWNYVEQMVPYTTQYWQLLNQTISPLKAPQATIRH